MLRKGTWIKREGGMVSVSEDSGSIVPSLLKRFQEIGDSFVFFLIFNSLNFNSLGLDY